VLLAGRIVIVPKPFPKEFRRDVVAVARQGDQSIAQVARSFGVSESCLSRWLKLADREDGIATGSPNSAASPPAGGASGASALEAENRELRKRTKQLEQENEILRRATAYFARDVLPE
jgi:transposase